MVDIISQTIDDLVRAVKMEDAEYILEHWRRPTAAMFDGLPLSEKIDAMLQYCEDECARVLRERP